MKYIQTTNGKHPVKYGMNALAKFTEQVGIKLSELSNMGQSMKLSDAVWLVYHGLKDGCRVEGKDFKYTFEDVADMIDEDASLIEKCMEVLNDSFGNNKKADNGKK